MTSTPSLRPPPAHPAPLSRPGQRPTAWMWLLLGTGLGVFTFGNHTVPMAAWIAPVLTLRFFRLSRWPVACLGIGLGTALVTGLGAWQGAIPFSGPVLYGIVLGGSLTAVLPYIVDRLLAPRLPGLWQTLAFPLAATGLEFLGMRGSPWGSFGAVAYSQYGHLALMQLVSLTGLWGLSLLIAWTAAMANYVWERRGQSCGRALALHLAIVGAALAYGEIRLTLAPTTDTVHLAGVTAVDSRQELKELWGLAKTDRDAFRRRTAAVHERYFAATLPQARAGAQLILWPEGAGIAATEDEAALIGRASALARAHGIYLAVPLVTLYAEERPHHNRLLLFDPTGDIVLDHTKFGGNTFEGGLLGDGVLQTIQTPLGTLSGVICWDLDFPEAMAQTGRNGTDILLVPAGDWRQIAPLHARMAAFRAIENGVSILRQADNGHSVALDPYGRVLAHMDHFAAAPDQRVLAAQLPIEGVWTLYPRIGDIFGWLAVFGGLGLAAWVLVQAQKGRRHRP